ncbi:MAG: NAD-dependent epimerase/dehydratase family protein [Candidatus Omnitrophica bacterium]|nr:NAD-dependent epimerase/dehydratase family protein [Candidatus Omnitrophota bacterium]MCA9409542.1 NAD-dependent epimerase/dehydratase family protein [Candidatus Omnitrophota bacterium]
MKIIVFGGDGFCGWPCALNLSAKGHEVCIVDNLSRRNIDTELECDSLTPIQPIGKRLEAWKEVSGQTIRFMNINIAEEYHRLLNLLNDYEPDSVIHYAEQRAAPYSMKSSKERRYTVNNNLNATNNILSAIVESERDIHVLHLGTMGVYGYGTVGAVIPEGYLRINIANPDGESSEKEILYPADPGSIYHMTKTQDALFFYFYNKNYGLRITDLHQGIVWGTDTDQTGRDERLINRFDYDGDYGTVLNRFLVESAVGHPLTVYGTGGQTRAFIHIQDSVRCVELAMAHPPKKGDRVHIYNQMTETHRLIDLANKVSELTGATIDFIENPRKEAEKNELKVSNECFLNIGLDPITLKDNLMVEVVDVARRYKNRVDLSKIPPQSQWVPNKETKEKVAAC